MCLLWIYDRDVGVGADLNRAFARIQSHDSRRISRKLGAHLLERDLAAKHAVSIGERHQRFEPGHPHRDLGPVAIPHRLLLTVERARVGGDDRDFAALQSLPQTLHVLWLLELRTTGVQMTILALENGIIENQILHARFSKHWYTSRLRRPDFVCIFPRSQVHDLYPSTPRFPLGA